MKNDGEGHAEGLAAAALPLAEGAPAGSVHLRPVERPSPSRRLRSRCEIEEWLVARKAELDALVAAEGLGQPLEHDQLSLEERVA